MQQQAELTRIGRPPTKAPLTKVQGPSTMPSDISDEDNRLHHTLQSAILTRGECPANWATA